jgi:predicted transcriptional regulator
MRTRRAKLEICAKILETIATERTITKTHIMYRANVSFRQLQKYLALLVELALIKEVERENRTTYEITERGKLLLEHYRKVKELMTIEK